MTRYSRIINRPRHFTILGGVTATSTPGGPTLIPTATITPVGPTLTPTATPPYQYRYVVLAIGVAG